MKETCWQKFKRNISVVTVEPCAFLFIASLAVSSLAGLNLNLDKACRVKLNYTTDICDRIIKSDNVGIENEVQLVQAEVAKVTAWKSPLQTALPAAFSLFIGAWSDRTRKRKCLILIPLVGNVISNIGLIFSTYYFQEISLEMTAVLDAVPNLLTGGSIILFVGAASFIIDTTTLEERTLRLGYIVLSVTLASPIGNSVSGILWEATGYYGIFVIVISIHILSFLYGFIRIKDLKIVSCSKENNVNLWKSFFYAENVLNTFRLIFKRRELILPMITVLLLNFLLLGPIYGESQVAYLYAKYKFQMTTLELSYYSTYNLSVGIIGTLFVTIFLSHKLHIKDSFIGIFTSLSKVMNCLILAFASNRGWYLAAQSFNIFGYSSLALVRSIATKIVLKSESAQISSLFGVTEALAHLIYMPVINSIYVATIDTFPGAFYLFDSGIALLSVLLFIVLYRKEITNKLYILNENTKCVTPLQENDSDGQEMDLNVALKYK